MNGKPQAMMRQPVGVKLRFLVFDAVIRKLIVANKPDDVELPLVFVRLTLSAIHKNREDNERST